MACRMLQWRARARLLVAAAGPASRGLHAKAARERQPSLEWLLNNYETMFPGLVWQKPGASKWQHACAAHAQLTGKSEAWCLNNDMPTASTANKMLRKLHNYFLEMPVGARTFQVDWWHDGVH